ncbi:MAG: hypothetical protein E7500_00425 [Ruminococcus sp.]|nr:hypothetical protein [Ruminococcus sp.]
MIFDITKPLPRRVEYNGKKYALDLSYNRVLDVYALLRDNELFNEEKNAFALAILVKESNPPLELLKLIFDEYLSITKRSNKNNGLRTVDFHQDGIYLYSSFMHDYGIDLIKERNRLHWWQFVSLFQGLSESTKMREVMGIRSRKIPERNKHNAEYIDNLLELKQYYALRFSQEELEENFRLGLAKLAETLKARAKQ